MFQNSVDVEYFNKTIGLGKNPKIINIGSILESSVVQVYQLMQILN